LTVVKSAVYCSSIVFSCYEPFEPELRNLMRWLVLDELNDIKVSRQHSSPFSLSAKFGPLFNSVLVLYTDMKPTNYFYEYGKIERREYGDTPNLLPPHHHPCIVGLG